MQLLHFLTYWSVALHFVHSYEIKATGGGVVKLGEDLELSLEVGKVWDRCRWFVYEHHADYQWCSFDLNADLGNATLHKCSNSSFEDVMTYSGTDPKACTITIKNVTEEFNCQWAARLDEDLTNTEMNVTIALPVKNVTIETEADLIAGQPGKIICKINGGRPAPSINFEIEKPSPMLVNDTISQIEDEDEIFTTVQEVTIQPKIEDHGKKVQCEALIVDKEGQALYEVATTSTEFKLDIKFAPQSVDNLTLHGNEGGNLTVIFNFQANPRPSEVKWVIAVPSIVNTGNYSELRKELINATSVIELTPGHNDDKYLVEEILEMEDLHYEASMTIFELDEHDHDDKYHLEVTNEIGVQKYFFDVQVDGTTSTGGGGGNNGTNGTDGTDGVKNVNHAAVIVIIAFIFIAMLCAIFLIVYKRKQVHNETAPLSTLESRRN